MFVFLKTFIYGNYKCQFILRLVVALINMFCRCTTCEQIKWWWNYVSLVPFSRYSESFVENGSYLTCTWRPFSGDHGISTRCLARMESVAASGVTCVMIRLAVLTELRLVTDGRTNRGHSTHRGNNPRVYAWCTLADVHVDWDAEMQNWAHSVVANKFVRIKRLCLSHPRRFLAVVVIAPSPLHAVGACALHETFCLFCEYCQMFFQPFIERQVMAGCQQETAAAS